MIGFLIQTTIVFAALYYAPFFGSIDDHARTVGIVILSVICSSLLYFIYDLIRSPVLLDRFLREDLGEAIAEAEKISQVESRLRVLGDLYSEGQKLFVVTIFEEKRANYDGWVERCEAYIDDNFDYSTLHQFRTSNSTSYRSPAGTLGDRLNTEITNKLGALDQIIAMRGGNILPGSYFSLFADKPKQPVYKYLDPIYPEKK